jgi:hypothetical protein
MPPRRRNQPRGPAPPPNQNAAFDQQEVSMIEDLRRRIDMMGDLRRQIEVLSPRVAQRQDPSHDGNKDEGDDYQQEEFEKKIHVNAPRRPAPIPFDERHRDGGFKVKILEFSNDLNGEGFVDWLSTVESVGLEGCTIK